jgi:hypothetical protein
VIVFAIGVILTTAYFFHAPEPSLTMS